MTSKTKLVFGVFTKVFPQPNGDLLVPILALDEILDELKPMSFALIKKALYNLPLNYVEGSYCLSLNKLTSVAEHLQENVHYPSFCRYTSESESLITLVRYLYLYNQPSDEPSNSAHG